MAKSMNFVDRCSPIYLFKKLHSTLGLYTMLAITRTLLGAKPLVLKGLAPRSVLVIANMVYRTSIVLLRGSIELLFGFCKASIELLKSFYRSSIKLP